MTGWMFRSLQRRLDQTIFDQHIPLTAEAMDDAHIGAGADIVRRASGFGSLGIGVLNYNPDCSLAPCRRDPPVPRDSADRADGSALAYAS